MAVEIRASVVLIAYLHDGSTERSRIVAIAEAHSPIDEWGGFFDHVPPAATPIPPADQAAGNQDGLRGFRVPGVVVSPFARRRQVSSTVFDHTSVLRMIEWRWDLEPLTVRDATANNLAEVLDFAASDARARLYDVPPGPFGAPCQPPVADKWSALQAMAASFGWPV